MQPIHHQMGMVVQVAETTGGGEEELKENCVFNLKRYRQDQLAVTWRLCVGC